MSKAISRGVALSPWIIFPMLFVLAVDDASPATAQGTPATVGESRPAEHKENSYEGTIVAFGNSLTEGFLVDEEQAYPAQLEKKLQANGYNYKVVNSGISGETSSGALSRVNWVLKLKPDIVILETGANDGFRGISPELVEKNISETIRILKERGVRVVLAGMQMLRNLGGEYTTAFGKIYPSVAEKQGVILAPFFLEGIAGDPKLNQADSIHPTAEGYKIVVENLYPYVVEAIETARAQGEHSDGFHFKTFSRCCIFPTLKWSRGFSSRGMDGENDF